MGIQSARALYKQDPLLLETRCCNSLFIKGMLVKKENGGFGYRSWRYAMLVDDKTLIELFSEPGKPDNCPDNPFTVSPVDTMLEYLDSVGVLLEK